jgi:hypothetical protein
MNSLENIAKNIYRFQLPGFQKLNKNLESKFNQYKDHNKTRKTHLFEGRYENIYISPDLIPELKIILSSSEFNVKEITGLTTMHSGSWFNFMEPGHITLPHTHDDADEIYSAVYYVVVPENSGNLIITEDNQEIIVIPKAGTMVLFPPDYLHSVTKNNSMEPRLSIGINVGN